MNFTDSSTLGQVRDWLRKHADKGADCPVCTQRVQVYKRKINSGMARSLIAMFTIGGTDWVHVPTQIGARSREEGKLAYWNLVEESKDPREDGGRAGWWRVTDYGREFVLNRTKVPAYARVYNGRVLGYEGSMVSIVDALGTKFNYSELMEGR